MSHIQGEVTRYTEDKVSLNPIADKDRLPQPSCQDLLSIDSALVGPRMYCLRCFILVPQVQATVTGSHKLRKQRSTRLSFNFYRDIVIVCTSLWQHHPATAGTRKHGISNQPHTKVLS